MTELILVIFAIASMVFALILSWTIKGRTLALPPLLLYIIVSISFINIGFLNYFLKYGTEPWAVNALLSASFGLFFVSIGGFMGGIIFRNPIIWPSVICTETRQNISYPIAVFTAFIIFGIVLIYFYFLGYVPFIEGFRILVNQGLTKGLLNTLRVSRDVYIRPEANYIPFQGFMEAMRYFGLPIVTIWFLHFYKQGLQRKFSLIMIIISFLLIVLTGQRWPLMYMFLTIAIYWSWTESNSVYFKKSLMKLVIFALLFGLVLTLFLGRTFQNEFNILGMLTNGFSELWNRMVLGNAKIPFLSYKIFPQQESYLYGLSWVQNIISYLPGPSPSYPVNFYRVVTGDPTGFTAPPDFYTEAFINFGWFGVIFLSFFWGIFLSIIQRYFLVSNKKLSSLSINALLCTLLSFSVMSGIIFILGGVIISIFILIVIIIQKYFLIILKKI